MTLVFQRLQPILLVVTAMIFLFVGMGTRWGAEPSAHWFEESRSASVDGFFGEAEATVPGEGQERDGEEDIEIDVLVLPFAPATMNVAFPKAGEGMLLFDRDERSGRNLKQKMFRPPRA